MFRKDWSALSIAVSIPWRSRVFRYMGALASSAAATVRYAREYGRKQFPVVGQPLEDEGCCGHWGHREYESSPARVLPQPVLRDATLVLRFSM